MRFCGLFTQKASQYCRNRVWYFLLLDFELNWKSKLSGTSIDETFLQLLYITVGGYPAIIDEALGIVEVPAHRLKAPALISDQDV